MHLIQHSLVPGSPTAVHAFISIDGGAGDIPPSAYVLQAGNFRVVADPRKHGKPGDIVVVWPRKKGPIITRRLARCFPYGTFYFRSLDDGCVFELRRDRVSAIHAVRGL